MANRLLSRIKKLNDCTRAKSDKFLIINSRYGESEEDIRQRIAEKLKGKPEPELVLIITSYKTDGPDSLKSSD